MRSVRIRTPARLHFGLFADGRGERKFGGVGMAIDKPGFEIEVRLDERDNIYSWIDPSLHGRITALLKKLREHFDVPPLRIDVESFIPHHAGLGSGTQLAMGIGEAAVRLIGLAVPRDELALILGRGKRSAVGFHAFHDWGLIIDGGKTDEGRISHAVFQGRFPEDWRIVLIQPPLEPGLHGAGECDAFRDGIVIPREVTDRMSRIALDVLAPGLTAADFSAFSEALYIVNRLSGECFAEVQGGVYAHPRLEEIVNDARKLGCRGVGQSSWGPTLFAMHESQESAEAFIERLKDLHPDLETTIATGVCPPMVGGWLGAQLLVSVRSAQEASDAMAGGADVIDVKEPDRGPLGRADAATRNAIFDLAIPWFRDGLRCGMRGISMAAGELAEFEQTDPADIEMGFAIRILAKVGFAGERNRDDWADRFLRLPQFPSIIEAGRKEAIYPEFIPAAYADHEAADSPHWMEIVKQICKRRRPWSYFLLDTFSKSHSFWEALGGREGVRELFQVCRDEKIKLALAGSVKIDDVDRLADEIGELPAVIAVRGAACKDGIRTNPIDRSRVSALLRRIMAAEVRLNRRGGSGSCG